MVNSESSSLNRSPYEILKISPWADDDTIKSKYFHLVKQYNPEYFPDEFIEIRTAYDVLKDVHSKAATDVRLLFPPPPFHSPDYPEYPEKILSLFKLNQELKTLCGDAAPQQLAGEERNQALHLMRGVGLYYAAHEQLKEAVEAWEEVLKVDPQDDITQQNIYYAQWNEGYKAAIEERYADAEAVFSGMIQKEIIHGAIFQNLAISQEQQGKKDESSENWSKVLEFYNQELKKSPDDNYLKALVLAIHKYTGGRHLKSGRENTADDFASAGSAKELGYACIQKGNWKQAVDALEKALSENESDVDVLCQLGWAYLNTNLHQKAFHMWNSALKKAPGKHSVVDHLVRGYTVFGKRLKEQRIFNQALVQFKNALKYEPENIDIRLQLADVYFQMRNFTSASQEYQKVLEVDPRNKAARHGVRESKRLGGLR